MMLSDVQEYVKGLRIGENVYRGKMDAKKAKSIGVYNSRHSHPPGMALGGEKMRSYGTKYVTFLVHWNKSQSETEKAAYALLEELRRAREVTVNNALIKFIQLLTEDPVDVGTDDGGIFEMVIEAAVIYRKERQSEK